MRVCIPSLFRLLLHCWVFILTVLIYNFTVKIEHIDFNVIIIKFFNNISQKIEFPLLLQIN